MRKKYYNIVVNVFKDWRDEGGRLSGRHRGFRRQVVKPCRGKHSLKRHIQPRLQTPGVGTSDFDAQMSGIKFWKDGENLRPVY